MPIQLYPHIVADQEILAGRPVIEGTQIPVSALVAAVARGESLDEVAREHSVTAADVRAALEFAAQRAGEAIAPDQADHPIDGQSAGATHQGNGQSETVTDTSGLSPLGRRLGELREQFLASGEPLLSWDEIDTEVADRRGERTLDDDP
jgi:uncharacterized protein (DUF433 family)